MDIERFFRLGGILTSGEIQKKLKLSQSQVSRYLRSLENLKRIGTGKATRYALKREIPLVGSSIPIFSVNQLGDLSELGTLDPIYPEGYLWKGRFYRDLPYFLNDLRPAGYLGRVIPRLYPEYPKDIKLWSGDTTLRYLYYHGKDLIGDLIIGEPMTRHYNELKESADYDELARSMENYGVAGSSAAGEHPKFLVRRNGKAYLVKFSRLNATRKCDLLKSEHLAQELLSPGTTKIIQGCDYLFYEIERFDRVGKYGRRGVISLFTLDQEFVGSGDDWFTVATKIPKLQSELSEVKKRQQFGELIGNTDMHGGNLSFFFDNLEIGKITPSYDMLPMRYLEEGFNDGLKFSSNYEGQIIELAVKFWGSVDNKFSDDFRKIADKNLKELDRRFNISYTK